MKKINSIENPEKDLLNDEFFLRSIFNPSEDTDDLWASLTDDDVLARQELEHSKEFMEVVRRSGKIMSNKEISELWTNIEIRNKENLRRRIRRRNLCLWGAAATILMLVASFFFMRFAETEEIVDIIAVAGDMETVSTDDDNIRLLIAGDKAVELQDKSVEISLNQEGKILVNSEEITRERVDQTEKAANNFNQLITPKGKRSMLTLSDGTVMHINSGSRVVFPEVFSGKTREIFVEGEVFLDVARHPDVPFIVRTNKLNIEVMGTSFNVSAYTDEALQSVVLVTGSVSVTTDSNRQARLEPSQMFACEGAQCSVSRVDVSRFVSWKDGLLVLDLNESISSLMRKLSRFYGKSITCDSSLDNYYGNGKLDLIDNFDEMLNNLTGILPIEVSRYGQAYVVRVK